MIPIGDSEKIRRFPWITLILILANIGAFVYIYFYSHNPQHLIKHYGLIPSLVTSGNWIHINDWKTYIPLLSASFIHAGWFHLIGNLLFLYIFGDNIEDRLGHIRFLIFYLICSIISMLVYCYAAPHSVKIVIGASGAIAGIMGAFYILFPKAKIKSFFIITILDIPAIYYLFVWFLFNLVSGLANSGGKTTDPVAWWAHIGGFIAGALLINLFLTGAPQVKSGKSKTKTAQRDKN